MCQLCFRYFLIFTFHMQSNTDSEHYNTRQLTSNRSHLQPSGSLLLPQCDRLPFTHYNVWILIHFNLQIQSKSPLKHTVWKGIQHILYLTTAWEVHHTSNRKLSSPSLPVVAHQIIHSIEIPPSNWTNDKFNVLTSLTHNAAKLNYPITPITQNTMLIKGS